MNRFRRSGPAVSLCCSLLLAGCTVSTVHITPAAIVTPSAIMLSATPNPATPGATVTITAAVSSSSVPVGVVTFYDGTAVLGTATLNNGLATYATQAFTGSNSTHQISASYAGDAIHAASTSSTVAVAIGGAAAPLAINAHASLSFAAANQTITGFGAAEAFDLTYLDAHPYASEMYRALFDPTAGLGLTYLRVQNLYRPNVTGFDPDTPAIVAAANAAHGSPLTILMSSWSPPANLKSNGTVNGCSAPVNNVCGGTVGTLIQVNGAYDYADFATYWYNALSAYQTLGVTPGYISIQNEPDFTAPYTGNRFNPTEATYNGTNFAGYGLAFDAVYKKIQGLSAVPKMVGPETLSAGQSFLDMAAQIPSGEVACLCAPPVQRELGQRVEYGCDQSWRQPGHRHHGADDAERHVSEGNEVHDGVLRHAGLLQRVEHPQRADLRQ